MKTTEQLAIESGAEVGTWDKSGNGQKPISFTHSELTAFAESYHAQKEAQKWISVAETPSPAHTEILLYREDAGVWEGEYTYCAEWVSEEDKEIEQYDDATLFSMDYWSFSHRGAHRCEGDLKPTHWRPLPSPPNDGE